MRYLITGHTGFKGSWLAAMLKMQGHEVTGIALDPEKNSHFIQSNISRFIDHEVRLDIRNKSEVGNAVSELRPEVVIHLAAQPLVLESFRDPVGTYETNVLGTINILEATRKLDNLNATLVITTDKVYKNKNKVEGYVESDELGGDDPYSSSKAAADLATQSWRASFSQSPLSIARAGNVIGGGDWARYRLIPDIINSINLDSKLKLRNPNAVRPWQHVLDCLNGYLTLVDHQLTNKVQEEWNFGPDPTNFKTVSELTESFSKHWGHQLEVDYEPSNIEETMCLTLNSDKSKNRLGWRDKLNFNEAVSWTSDWYSNVQKGFSPDLATVKQIENFFEL